MKSSLKLYMLFATFLVSLFSFSALATEVCPSNSRFLSVDGNDFCQCTHPSTPGGTPLLFARGASRTCPTSAPATAQRTGDCTRYNARTLGNGQCQCIHRATPEVAPQTVTFMAAMNGACPSTAPQYQCGSLAREVENGRCQCIHPSAGGTRNVVPRANVSVCPSADYAGLCSNLGGNYNFSNNRCSCGQGAGRAEIVVSVTGSTTCDQRRAESLESARGNNQYCGQNARTTRAATDGTTRCMCNYSTTDRDPPQTFSIANRDSVSCPANPPGGAADCSGSPNARPHPQQRNMCYCAGGPNADSDETGVNLTAVAPGSVATTCGTASAPTPENTGAGTGPGSGTPDPTPNNQQAINACTQTGGEHSLPGQPDSEGKIRCTCPPAEGETEPAAAWQVVADGSVVEGSGEPQQCQAGAAPAAPAGSSPSGGGACDATAAQAAIQAVQNGGQPSFMEGAEEAGTARVNFPGTTPFEGCQQMTTQSWERIAGSAGNDLKLKFIDLFRRIEGDGGEAAGLTGLVSQYQNAWNGYHGTGDGGGTTTMSEVLAGTKNPSELNTAKEALTRAANDLRTQARMIIREAEQARDEYKQCAAVALMTGYTDYGDEDQITPDQEASTIDGTITCRTSGAETQDFGECKAGIMAYNAAMIANQGMDIYDQVDFADFQMEQQMAMMQNQQAGAGADFTLALRQQKAALEKQVEALQRRAVLDGVKMGIFFAVRANMPTRNDLVQQCSGTVNCSNQIAESYYLQLVAYIRHKMSPILNATPTEIGGQQVTLGSMLVVVSGGESPNTQLEQVLTVTDSASGSSGQAFGVSSNSGATLNLPTVSATQTDELQGQDMCSEAMHSDPGYALIENEEARDAMMAELLKATADLATHLLQMNILKKQIARLEDAINGIQNFEPIPLTYTGEDLLATLCSPEAFPQHPDCLNLDPTRTFGFPDQTFNINGPDATGTNGGNLANTNGNDATSAVGNNDPTNRVTSRTRPVASVGKGGNGGLSGVGGSGGLKGGGGLGGGGGGAGGGSAAAPGGGRGGGGAPASQGSSARKAVGYDGSSAGSLAYGAGNRGATAKKKAKNPFANFKKKNGEGGVLNFRNPAGIGGKSSNLFQMISNGYTRAVKNNQLLKYEAVKKKKTSTN